MPKTLLLLTILFTCPRQTIAQKNTPPLTYPLTALSDDTTVNYAVTIVAHHRFAYTISYGSNRKDAKREYYDGTWKYQNDTLFLQYRDEKRPPGVACYLLEDTTGHWLIQFFTDGRPRVFLRTPQRPLF